jgi:hypothetical protein
LIGCLGVENIDTSSRSDQGCLSPPKNFSESDLIGTWVSLGHNQDTLIIRDDGKYKQIIHIEYIDIPDVDFESDWQSWWLEENSADGVPYLHLERMNLCAAFPNLSDCEHTGGTEKDWNNFCSLSHTRVQSNGEGILAVMGAPSLSQPPRDIQLSLVFKAEMPWGYELEEP